MTNLGENMPPPGSTALVSSRGDSSKAPPLFEYLALRNVQWSLVYVSFLGYVIDITTYLVKNAAPFMAVALLTLFFGARRTRWPFAVVLLLVFWIWAAIVTVLSPYPGDLGLLEEFGKVLLVFLVAVNVLWHPPRLRFFLLIFIACFAFFPVRGTLTNYFVHHHFIYAGRPAWAGLFGNPNDLAALTILMLALAASFLHNETPRALRFASLLLCMVFPFTILLTQSRAGFIGMCVFLILSVLSIGRNRTMVILALAIIATVVVTAVPPAVWQRIAGLQNATSVETISEMDPEGSAKERWQLVLTAFQVVSDHPLAGVGRGQGRVAIGIYNPAIGSKSVHNSYLEVLVETGIPGLVLFLWLVFLLLFRARRARLNAGALRETSDWRRLQLFEFGLYGYLVAGIWGTYAYLSIFYVYLAILFAQTEALDALAKKDINRL